MPHHVDHDQAWLHLSYSGEDVDDGCRNELSFYRQPDGSYEMVLTNVDFAQISHDNTWHLTKQDAQAIVKYLQ